MASVRFIGKVLSDGRLSFPKKAREELCLEAGQEVEVVVQTREQAERASEDAYAPLRKIIGLATKGRSDAAEHHDRYLYGKKNR